MEGQIHQAIASADITHNTFVAYSETYDGLHRLFPINFYYPSLVPGTAGFPVPVTVRANVYAGFSKAPDRSPAEMYRGTDFLEINLTDLDGNFRLKTPSDSLTPTTNLYQYVSPVGFRLRMKATYGSFD